MTKPGHEPLVSVVMPVYNAGAHLLSAVASIMDQSLTDWELICVDDGSTDSSGEMLDWFAQQDQRVRVVHQANGGIVAALNAGCELARAPLIARMDADDIALPDRLDKQVQFLRQHPKCVVVGGGIWEIDSDGDLLSESHLSTDHDQIVDDLLHRRTGHFHPTVMMRAEAWRAMVGYRPKYQWIEDHDLWLRLSRRGQLANMSDVLLCYRQHASSVCWQRSQQQRELMNELMRDAYGVRGQQAPAEVIVHQTVQRTAAGPGKWARLAAKGGFLSSAYKHWRLMMADQQSTSYKIRMSLEIALRGAVSCVKRITQSRATRPYVPSFAEWQQLWDSRAKVDRQAA